MAHGGSRPGSGRKAGASTKLNQQARKEALGGGISPLDYMLTILRDDTQAPDARMDAAKSAAPYVHARLSSIDQKSEVTHRNVVAMPETSSSTDEWLRDHGNKGVH
jgi:hypothetical protein